LQEAILEIPRVWIKFNLRFASPGKSQFAVEYFWSKTGITSMDWDNYLI